MLKQIYSQVYKNFTILTRNYFRLFDITFWPLTLLFSISLFVDFIQANQEIIAMVILGVTGWRVVYHMQIDMTTSYMEEYWGHSLNHFLISPLRWIEFILGNIITGTIKFALVLIIYLIVGKFMFSFTPTNLPIFALGLVFLAVFGVILGLITMSLVTLYHDNAYTAAYIVPDLLVLLSGVYYPISIFPAALQSIIKFIPAVYGFNVLKSTIGLEQVDYGMLFGTTIIWLVLAILLFAFCINHAKKTGRLGRMM